MKIYHCLAAVVLIAPATYAQNFQKVQPSGRVGNAILGVPASVTREVAATVQELASFRDERWSLLTLAQIGAGVADTKTSLDNLHACATCREVGLSRLVVGQHPDAHKYVVGGLVEITVEAVAAHYLRNHISSHKWYWRSVWVLPQSISLYGHTQAAIRNARVRLNCDPSGSHCY